MILRMRGGGMQFPRQPVVLGVLPPMNGADEGVDGRLALARQMVTDGADWVEWCGGGSGEKDPAEVRVFLERWSAGALAVPVVIRTGGAAAAQIALEAGGSVLCAGRGLEVEVAARLCAGTGAALLLAHRMEGAGAEAAPDFRVAFARSAAVFFEQSLSLVEKTGLSRDAVLLDAGDVFEGILGGCVQRDLMERLGRPWCAAVSGRRLSEWVLGVGGETPGSTTQEAALVAGVVQAVLAGARILRVEHAWGVRAAVYAARTISAVLGCGRA